MIKKLLCLTLAVFSFQPAFAENYLINGGQESRIQYKLVQKVEPQPGIKTLMLSYVVPVSFKSPTYNQEIRDLAMKFSPEPTKRDESVDKRGNRVIGVSWSEPTTPINATVSLTAINKVLLQSLDTHASFPLSGLPTDVVDYLSPTAQVQANDPKIQAKARELTAGVTTEFDAVQRILTWVIDHLHYVLEPEAFDAMYALNTGKGNCQNYSHLAAALLRAVGIPARIVNGITLDRPYDVTAERGSFTFQMAKGRHSWIEVYFPDLGWVPFDPQQTELFVSNRFIRIEVGIDNNETVQDGLVRWTQSRGAAKATPAFEELIEADFPEDRVTLTMKRQKYGPQQILLCPDVKATFQPVVLAASPPPPPPVVKPEEVKKLRYTKPYTFGNLEFPEGVDFLFTRGPATAGGEGQFELRKNFLVETAEYVTRSAQYAQTFILPKPVQLQKVGLALHKFGGDGFLWVELLKDDGRMPGERIATSAMVSLDELSSRPGYFWVDFDFSKESPVLAPGRYWIALGFTGSPIVNWFYSYGKPVGPVDGTRYRTILDTEWSKSLAFEFNYRVQGLTTE